MSIRINRITYNGRGLPLRASVHCYEPGLRHRYTVRIFWTDICGHWLWFGKGWCGAENWRRIVPVVASIERCNPLQ